MKRIITALILSAIMQATAHAYKAVVVPDDFSGQFLVGETDPASLHLDGSTTMTGPLDAGDQSITNVANIAAETITTGDITFEETIQYDGTTIVGVHIVGQE